MNRESRVSAIVFVAVGLLALSSSLAHACWRRAKAPLLELSTRDAIGHEQLDNFERLSGDGWDVLVRSARPAGSNAVLAQLASNASTFSARERWPLRVIAFRYVT